MTGRLPLKPLKSAILSAALLAVLLHSAFASEEIPVDIKADSLRFDQETGIIRASGSVEASMEKAVIRADSIVVDTGTSIATAEGNVSVSREGSSVYGSRMVYYLKTDTSSFRDFTTVISVEGAAEPIYFKIGDLRDYKDFKEGSDGRATTCGLKDPHYFVMGKRFYLIPEDKMVAAGATAYVGGVPVMWLPFYIYDLARRRVSLLMPIIGSNDVEGEFVKSEIQYFVDSGASGSVYVDLMKKKGVGYGIEHDYILPGTNTGTAYAYHIRESDTGLDDWVIRLENEFKYREKDRLKLKYDYKNIYLVPPGRLDQTGAGLDYSFNDGFNSISAVLNAFDNRMSNMSDHSARLSFGAGTLKTDYFYSYNGNIRGGWQNVNQGLSHNQSFFDNALALSVNANYYRSITAEGVPFDERLEPTVSLTYRGPFYTLKLTESVFMDPDKDKYSNDEFVEYVERMPEVSLALNHVTLATVNLRQEIGYGRFHESKYIPFTASQRHFTADRYRAAVSADKTFALPIGSSLLLSGAVEQFSYSTGDQQYSQKENATLKTELGGFFSNSLRYELGFAAGSTPFFFDSTGYNYRTLKDTITFYKGTEHRFTIDGGYNYLTSKYFDLLLNYSARPSDSLNYSLASGYDIEGRKWRDLVTTLGLFAGEWLKESLSHTYDLNNGRTTYATNALELSVGDSWESRWRVKLGHTYDIARGAIVLQEAEIAKDLHCWEAKYGWNDFRKEWRVTFTLKAFPTKPIGFASGLRGTFFEGFSGESPARY